MKKTPALRAGAESENKSVSTLPPENPHVNPNQPRTLGAALAELLDVVAQLRELRDRKERYGRR